VTQQDYSSPEHRLDNLVNMRFVRAYARVRHHILNPLEDDQTSPYLQGYVMELDKHLADELQLPATTLVGRLVDLGRDLCANKGAKDEAE